ncbi:MAG: hypothetical protein ABSF77_15965 [Spirochaetia bacterium]|jgi:hypothetical protein
MDNTIVINGKFIKRIKAVSEPVEPFELSEAEKKRKELTERCDKAGILYSGEVQIDQDSRLLDPPDAVKEHLGEKLVLAKAPPLVEFGSIPYDYRYFPEERIRPDNANWSSWSQGTYDTESKRFFGAIGDHGCKNAHLHLVEYDTEKKKIKALPEVNRILGRKCGQFGDGKIHGFPDMYQPFYHDTPHIWFCTYWCRYPEPLEQDYATGYRGGHILSYNPLTEEFYDYGVPVERSSWPLHRLDRKRGLLYGLGMFTEFLCWDMNSLEPRWAGYLPPCGRESDPFAIAPGMKWFNRCLLVDEHTGFVYSNNLLSKNLNLIRYNPHTNRFTELDVPMNPLTPLRSHTRERDSNGLFWGMSLKGDIYSFQPDTLKLEVHGRPWPLEDCFSVTIDSSPGGRYLYFGIAAHGRGYPYGTPILQYDKATKKCKILAFLFPYYYEKYGYIAGGTYSFKLNDSGDKLFSIWNGDFTDADVLFEKYEAYDPVASNWSLPHPHDAFGHCAVTVINIPASEREE